MNKTGIDEKIKIMKYLGNSLGIKIYHFYAKKLLKTNQAKTMQLLNQDNYSLIDLRSAVNKKMIPQDENLQENRVIILELTP